MKAPQKSPRLPVEKANGLLARELGELQIGLRSASSDYGEELPPYAAILDKIVRGRLAFFLGAGACMGRLPLRAEFYNDLIAQFSEESDRGDAAAKSGNMERPRIAQHFADKYDRETLYSQVNQRLAESKPAPRAIHWFIATLRDRLLSKGYNVAPQWIFTTNYDDWMEQARRQNSRRHSPRDSGPLRRKVVAFPRQWTRQRQHRVTRSYNAHPKS